jgi:hypothetical protein
MQHIITVILVRLFNHTVGGWYSNNTRDGLSNQELERIKSQKYPWFYELLYLVMVLLFLSAAIGPWTFIFFPLLESGSIFGLDITEADGTLSGVILILLIILMPLFIALTIAALLTTLICMLIPQGKFKDYLLWMQAKSGWRLTWMGTVRLETAALLSLILLAGVLVIIARLVLP